MSIRRRGEFIGSENKSPIKFLFNKRFIMRVNKLLLLCFSFVFDLPVMITMCLKNLTFISLIILMI
jgi:hypothetical protein